MLLLDLPGEVLLLIAERVESEKDLSAYCRANRGLYELHSAFLYRRNAILYRSYAFTWGARVGREETVLKALEHANGLHALLSARTSLLLAAQGGHERIVRLLLDRRVIDPNVGATNLQDPTPLSLAAERGHDGVVHFLLAQEGVDADLADYNWRTPLSYAAHNGHVEVVRSLLNTGSVDVCSSDGNDITVLSFAARRGHKEVVQMLLDSGSDPNFADNIHLLRPLEHAAAHDHFEVVQLLKRYDQEVKDTQLDI